MEWLEESLSKFTPQRRQIIEQRLLPHCRALHESIQYASPASLSECLARLNNHKQAYFDLIKGYVDEATASYQAEAREFTRALLPKALTYEPGHFSNLYKNLEGVLFMALDDRPEIKAIALELLRLYDRYLITKLFYFLPPKKPD